MKNNAGRNRRFKRGKGGRKARCQICTWNRKDWRGQPNHQAVKQDQHA